MLLSPTRRVSSGAYDQSAGQVHINAQGIVNGPLLKENEGAACVKRLTSALIGAKNHELRTLLAGLTLRVYDGLNTPFELSEKGTVVRVDRRFLLALRGEADVLCALRALLLPALGRSTADTTKLTAADRKRLQDIGTRLGSSPWKIQLENHITALTATPASDLRSVVDDALLSVLDELASESALTLVPAASGLSLARPRISRKNQSVERRDRRRRLLFETVESRQLLSTTLTPADLATTPIPIGQERTGEIGHELVTSGTAPIYGPVYLRPGELFSNENATEVFGPAETGTGPYLGSVDLFGQERAETAPMRFAFSPVDPQTGAGTAEGISANNQWRYVYSYTIGENGQPALERLLSETTTLLTTVEGRPMTRVFTTTHDYVPAVTGALRDSIGVITGNSEFPLTTPITISTTHITDTGHDERGSPIYYQPLTARVATSFTISRNGVETPGRLISLNYPLGLGAFTPEVAHASQTEELHLHAARVFTHDPHPDGLNPNTVYVSELKPVGLDGDLYAGLFSGLGLRTLTGQPSPITREAPFQFLVYRVLNVGPGQQAAGPFVGTYRYSTREQTPSGGSYWSMEVGGSWTRSAEVEISHSIESGGGGGSLTVSGAMPRYTGSGGMEGR
ncbi:MAG: hypothetical protein WCG78_06670, partial [Candidatus Omnitrophota bacterium]